MRSELGNVPCIPHPSANPVTDESEDSSSAKWLYEFERLLCFAEVLVTCGSVVRSHPDDSSSEDREAKDADAGLGGNIPTEMVLERHLGIGIDSYSISE